MRFQLKGTRAILTPASKTVQDQYLARPDKYIPIVEDAVASPAAPTFDGLNVDELKAYAADRGINIGNATSESGIRKKILEAESGTGQ